MLQITDGGQAWNARSVALAMPSFALDELIRLFVINENVFDDSVDKLSALLSSTNPDAVALTDLVHLSLESYATDDDALTIVSAWTVVEVLLRDSWSGVIGDLRTERPSRINAPRAKSLRDLAIAVIAEMLELSDKITTNRYQTITRVRKARNGWLHEKKQPKPTDARAAALLSAELLSEAVGLDIHVSPLRG